MHSTITPREGHRSLPCNLLPPLAALFTMVAFSPINALAQTPPELSRKVMQMERDREAEFESFFGEDLAEVSKDPDQMAAELSELSRKSG